VLRKKKKILWHLEYPLRGGFPLLKAVMHSCTGSSSPQGIDGRLPPGAPAADAAADASQYRTPECLVNLEANDHDELEELIYAGLVQVIGVA